MTILDHSKLMAIGNYWKIVALFPTLEALN
jgi:hypothetical protein